VIVRSKEQRRAQRSVVFGATAPAERNAGLVRSRPSVNWQDELESPEKPEQDVELRRLVDCLPPDERHMVSRTSFGGSSVRVAAEEIELPPYRGERVLRRGLDRLRGWLTEPGTAPKRDPGIRRGRTTKVKGKRTRAWETLDESALETTMTGRYRGDGRRLDSYTPYETEGWTAIPHRIEAVE